MVAIAASICTASGKVLLSRQFVEVPKSRVEGLLAAFPKLLGKGSQHTSIETENIRYVYQPLNNLFLVLITNRQSNILQDIETLNLMGRVVNKVTSISEEEEIIDNAFTLLSAFDEIVSLGYRDSVTLSTITNTIEMESHEERIQDIIAKNKEKEAKELMKEKIKMMDEQRKRDALNSQNKLSTSTNIPGSYRPVKSEASVSKAYDEPVKKKSSGGGMKLGSKNKTNQVISSIQKEINIPSYEDEMEAEASYEDHEPIHFQFEEKVKVELNRDGGLENLDLRGELFLNVHDERYSFIKAELIIPNKESFSYMTNPKMDKSSFNEEGVLALKDQSKGFPINQSVGVLKWKYNNRGLSNLPFSITCWLSPSDDGNCDVSLEVKLEQEEFEINDLVISIPLQTDGDDLDLKEYDGEYKIADDGYLEWFLPTLNSEHKESTLEFTGVSENQGESFFPLALSFTSNQLISGLKIENVISIEEQEACPFSTESRVFCEECLVN